jgi:peptide deformylase
LVSTPVGDLRDPAFLEAGQTLIGTLSRFREQYGFGRAIAAPQIGVNGRFLAVNLGRGPFLMINPEIRWSSAETFTLWDDCMSFPWLFVRVRRHASISVRFLDAEGRAQEWDRLPRDQSELFQHEIDHLDGVLALDRAVDRESLLSREVFESDPERYRRQVDYVIGNPSQA